MCHSRTAMLVAHRNTEPAAVRHSTNHNTVKQEICCRHRDDVRMFAQNQAQKWAEQSAATQQAIERLQTARHLVSTLGFQVMDS